MGRSPEDFYLTRIDRGGNFVDNQYYVGNEMFNKKVAGRWNSVRPKPPEFSYYNPKDLVYVGRIEQQPWYVKERSQAAVGMEYVIMEGIYEYGWLGDNVNVTPTSKYDDLVNHIDMVAAMKNELGEEMYLGIDTTSSGDYNNIKHKLGKTADQLLEGRIGEVKYYIDDATSEKKRLNVPRVVIAASKGVAKELIEEMVKNPEQVASNPVQLEVLEEIIEQLKFGLEILEKKQSSDTWQNIYKRLIDHLSVVQKERAQSLSGKDYDRAHSRIINDCLREERERLLAA